MIDRAGLTDWLQGWGTVAGAIFSGLAALATFALLWHEVRKRRFERQELEIAQARSVFVTLEGIGSPAAGDKPTFTLRNISNNVISDAVVEIRPRDDSSAMLGASADYLAAGEQIRVVWHDVPPTMWVGHTDPPDLFDTRVSFTDAAGLRWERRGRRQPTRVWAYEHINYMPPIVPADVEAARPRTSPQADPVVDPPYLDPSP